MRLTIVMVLALTVLILGSNAYAECKRVEFAELQSMSKEELDGVINDLDREADYIFKQKSAYRMSSRIYGELSDKWAVCMQESIRVHKFKQKKFPPEAATAPPDQKK